MSLIRGNSSSLSNSSSWMIQSESIQRESMPSWRTKWMTCWNLIDSDPTCIPFIFSCTFARKVFGGCCLPQPWLNVTYRPVSSGLESRKRMLLTVPGMTRRSRVLLGSIFWACWHYKCDISHRINRAFAHSRDSVDPVDEGTDSPYFHSPYKRPPLRSW